MKNVSAPWYGLHCRWLQSLQHFLYRDEFKRPVAGATVEKGEVFFQRVGATKVAIENDPEGVDRCNGRIQMVIAVIRQVISVQNRDPIAQAVLVRILPVQTQGRSMV